MTWYELWLFLHISGVSVWLGGAVVAQVLGALAKRSGDPARSAALGRDMAVVGPWVFMPASLVVLVTGILLTDDGNWDWGEWFIVLGLIGWAVVAFTGFGYITRAMNQVGMRMATVGPSPGQPSRPRRPSPGPRPLRSRLPDGREARDVGR
jgi:uncharacterized membrane protein